MNDRHQPGLFVENFFRTQWRNAIASLVGAFGIRNLDLIENAVQIAMTRALNQWAISGVPDNPGGWIYRTAQNALHDELRRKEVRTRRAEEVKIHFYQSYEVSVETGDPLRDDVLRMIFVCSHPQIKPRDSLVLTLRVVCGLGYGEIAAGLCMADEAVRKSLTRCKVGLARQGDLFEEPMVLARPERLVRVLRTIYLLFNEGYFASHGDSLIRRDLCQEAERLMDLLRTSKLSGEASIWALSALIAFQASRFDARTDAAGGIVLLQDQDRARWCQGLIARGMSYFDRSLMADRPGNYHYEAAIAACHVMAESYDRTDWDRIIGYYDALLEISGSSPVVGMNRAVAVMERFGPASALGELEALEARREMKHSLVLLSLLAECHRRLGNDNAAKKYYKKSI